VAHRLADARTFGAEAAVIQAVRNTSAPICERLGFVELGGFEFFEWQPAGHTGGAGGEQPSAPKQAD
jgi:hypothetical protein